MRRRGRRARVSSRASSYGSSHAHELSAGPQPGLKKGEKRPVYVLNITIPPIFVDNHVEPSKSAVNIQVGPLGALKSNGLITHPRIIRSYILSSRISFKNS